MGSTVRYRFVAFELADDWADLAHKPRWELKHREREGTFLLSIFPTAEGVSMDLGALLHLEHERQRCADEMRARMKEHDPANRRPWMMRETFLDEETWSEGPVFCVTTRRTLQYPEVLRGMSPEPIRYRAGWTVSDGRYVIEAGFGDVDSEAFRAGVADCDAMMRSVRFEGPS